jgi:uncharacterized protein YhjY with autotransporter beta-barrel domain
MSKEMRLLGRALCAPALLAAAATHSLPAAADVVANDIVLAVPSALSGSSSGGTFTFNITEQNGLVDGTSRPVQLLNADLAAGDVNRNCITVVVPPGFSGSSTILTSFTVVEGGSDIDLNLLDTASGSVNFVPSSSSSSLPTVVEVSDQSCGDVQFNPIAMPDTSQATANHTTAIPVLTNDQPQGLPGRRRITFGFNQGTTGSGEARLIVQSTTQQGGTVVAQRDDGTILYTPAPGFVGQDTFQYTLADYVVQGFEPLNATATVTVTVTAQPAMATIFANGMPATGTTISIPDSNGQPGEAVSFDGSQSSTGSGLPVTSYEWFIGNSQTPAQAGASPIFAAQLPDGQSLLRLVVRDSQNNSAMSSLTVTVGGVQNTPLVQVTINETTLAEVADTDFLPGEQVRFDASKSTSSSGATIIRYEWFVGDATEPALGAKFEPQLPDGPSTVRLVVTDANNVSESVTLEVIVRPTAALAEIQNLTPNQAAVAKTLDRVCSDLAQRDQAQAALTEDQQDLLARCQGVLGTGNLSAALDELSAQDFNGARTQALLFTNAIYAGVQDRLMALRGGARGMSFAGLNVVIDGKSVPVAQMQSMLGELLGGGAAADDEPGALLGDKWGTWTRGNFTFGRKDRSSADQGFEADQFSLVVGLDYRMSDRMVLGSALSFGSANVAYNPDAQGGIDTSSVAASFYGSRYVGKHYYLDAVFNAASSSYDAQRRISYMESGGVAIDRMAKGDTDGLTLSGGLSGGYDYSYKAFSFTPNVGVFYSDSSIDAFRERGALGLNLRYDEQSFQSLTANFGLRASYTVSLPWGVVIPYLGSDYVRELKRNVEVFNVRFASDPANPTPPIEVRSNDPDQSYWRLTGGLSAQFPFGISGYVEYQRLQSFDFVHFTDLAMGLRMQFSF